MVTEKKGRIAGTKKSRQPFGRRPFLLSCGDKQDVAADFDRSMPADRYGIDVEDVALWVRNNSILWDRIQHVACGRFDMMLRFTPECFKRSFSWGFGYNPVYVLSCHVADLLMGCLKHVHNTHDIYDVADSLVRTVYAEWRLRHRSLPKRLCLKG